MPDLSGILLGILIWVSYADDQ